MATIRVATLILVALVGCGPRPVRFDATRPPNCMGPFSPNRTVHNGIETSRWGGDCRFQGPSVYPFRTDDLMFWVGRVRDRNPASLLNNPGARRSYSCIGTQLRGIDGLLSSVRGLYHLFQLAKGHCRVCGYDNEPQSFDNDRYSMDAAKVAPPMQGSINPRPHRRLLMAMGTLAILTGILATTAGVLGIGANVQPGASFIAILLGMGLSAWGTWSFILIFSI